jgi:hypothetical protein
MRCDPVASERRYSDFGGVIRVSGEWAGGQEATADGFLAGVCTPILGRPKPHPRALSPAGGVGKKDSNKV